MGRKSAQGCAEGAQRVRQGAQVVAPGNGMVGGWSGCGPTVKNRLSVDEEMCGRHPGGAPTNRREATGASVCIGWDFMTWHCGRYKHVLMWVGCPFQWRWSATRAIPAVHKAPLGAHG